MFLDTIFDKLPVIDFLSEIVYSYSEMQIQIDIHTLQRAKERGTN